MDDLDLGMTIKGFAPGQKVFNRYSLVRMLGRGGMGVVWLAKDDELGRETALKFLPEVVASDRAAIEDMKREVRRAIDLAHPHIVKIHDFINDGRTAAVSMEYIAGGTLSALRIDQPGQVFPVEQLAPWIKQLCAALDYAHHDAEVVHRDLKPTNLMIDKRGRLKVLDFGIAASISDSVSRVSNKAGSSGTPVYMSPQQMMGEEPAVTDDVYSVGATLYELLTGKPPFHAGNILLQVQNKVAPPLNERRKALNLPPAPEAWEKTIAACLAKDAAARPPSAGALGQMLQGEMAPPAVAPPVLEPTAQPPVSPTPSPTPATPVGESPEISGLRRWFLAPLAGAAVPALAIYLLIAENDSNRGAFDPESMMLGLFWLGFVFVGALVLTAIRHAAKAREARGFVIFAAIIGASLGLLTMGFELEAGFTVVSAILGGAGLAIAAFWLHVIGFGRPSGSAPLHAGWRIGQILGAGLAIMYFGLVLPAEENAASAARRAAYEREQREQREEQERRDRLDAENRAKAEAAAREAEAARVLALRRTDAAPMLVEAFRMVFDRSPTAAERQEYTDLMVANTDWDTARLRRELRQSAAGRLGGRLLVPEEFPTIQEAIEAATEGNTVLVGPGRYSEPLLIRRSIKLVGVGADQVVVETRADVCPLNVAGAVDVTVRGFTFRHTDRLDADSRMSVVALNPGSRVTFEGNKVLNANGNAIHVKGAGRKLIRNNTVIGARWAGVAVYGGTTSEIRDNLIQNQEQQGIGVFEPVVSLLIAGNTLRNNRQSGMWIGQGDNCTLEQNDVSGSGAEGQLYGGIGIGEGKPRLVGNKSQGNFGGGIWWNQEKAAPVIGAGNVSDGQALTPSRR